MSADIHSNFQTAAAVIPQALSGTSDLVGEIIDTRGYSHGEFIFMTDEIAASTLTAQLLLEDGDDSALSDAAAISDTFLLGTEATTAITTASDSVALGVGVRFTKRYVRATVDVATNNGTDVVAVAAILGGNRYLPES